MINWSKAPFVRIIIPFIIGMVGYLLFPVFIHYKNVVVILSIFLATHIFFLINRNYSIHLFYGVFHQLTFIVLGFILVSSYNNYYLKGHYHNYTDKEIQQMHVAVISELKVKQKSTEVLFEVLAVKHNKKWTKTKGKLLCYFLGKDTSFNQQVTLGKQLYIKPYIKSTSTMKSMGDFNYGKYLNRKQIFYYTFLKPKHCTLDSATYTNIFIKSLQLRELLVKKLDIFNYNQKAVISAVIFGQKKYLSKDIKENYSSSGAMHVLAISGLHLGIVFLVLDKLLLFLGNKKLGLKLIKVGLIILVLWVYALITGLSPSVTRAAIMFSFLALGNLGNKKIPIYNKVFASAFLILLFRPYMLLEVGFQLSYLAVLGIIATYKEIYNKLYLKYYLLDKLWAMVSVSVASQVFIFPIVVFYFNAFPLYFILTNILIVPLVSVVLLVGWLFVFSTYLPFFITNIFYFILKHTVDLMNFFANNVPLLPYSKVEYLHLTIWDVFNLELIVVFLVLLLTVRRKKYFYLFLMSMIVFLTVKVIIKWELIPLFL